MNKNNKVSVPEIPDAVGKFKLSVLSDRNSSLAINILKKGGGAMNFMGV